MLTTVLFVPVAVKFDFYYDLNDDVLIKDILSGVYSGQPSGYTMQLLYPLGLLLGLLYRVLSIPVFGVFLLLCQYGSIFLVAYRSLSLCRTHGGRLLAALAQGAFWAAAYGMHLVFLQYTVTAGMLAGTAIFLVVTSEKEKPFLKENVPALLLYWTAFCLRTEMALLLLPLAGVAGLCKWGREDRIFTKENVRKYVSLFGVLVLGLLLVYGADSLAYAGRDWTAFRQFFDARTELYDYQKDFIDHYEENAAVYEALGVTRQRHALLENYNFGVDDGLDAALLTKLEEAARERSGMGGLFAKSLSEGVWSLVYGHWAGKGDFPCNAVLLLGAALLFGLGFVRGRHYLLWQIPLCMACGSVLWLFLLLRDRPVDRVLHPLYLGQILVFAGMLLAEAKEDGGRVHLREAAGYGAKEQEKSAVRIVGKEAAGKFAALAACVAVLCLCLPQAGKTFDSISQEFARREAINVTNGAVMAYCSAHPDRLYLADVYSTVSFSEKISLDRNKPFNYDLLGGWMVKSPLTQKKLEAFGFSSMQEAVCAGGTVSLLAEPERDMGWLEEYFEAERIPGRIVKTEVVAEGMDVYQVLPENGGT